MIDTKELREKITIKGLDVVADTDILVVLDRLEAWENVFGHLGTPDEVGNEWRALSDRLEAAESECLEQARLNGMGASREAALLAKLEAAEKSDAESLAMYRRARDERDALRAKIARMERQEPVAWARKLAMGLPSFGCVTDLKYRPSNMPESAYMPLYALPGAQVHPAPSVPECPYPCGWRNLLKHAIEDGAYLARSINEDEPVTENARAVIMRMVMRLRDVLMAVNNAAPEAKP